MDITMMLAAAALAKATTRAPRLHARFEKVEQAEPFMGAYQFHEHTVEIWSADGTIHIELPRLGPEHPMEPVEVTATRKWPTDNPAYTPQFLRWTARVQRAHEWGPLPPEQKTLPGEGR